MQQGPCMDIDKYPLTVSYLPKHIQDQCLRGDDSLIMLCSTLVFKEPGKWRHTGKTFEGENFRGCAQNTPFTGKLSWCIRPMPLCSYCTQQMIQGENFRDWLKNRENRESFPPQKFCRIRYMVDVSVSVTSNEYNFKHS